MRELEGAIRISKKMQDKKEDAASFDEEYYWKEIYYEEKAGNKFLELVNEVKEYENQLITKHFRLVSEEDSKIEKWMNIFLTCLFCGFMYFVIYDTKVGGFIGGFLWPFLSILIYSIFYWNSFI